MYLIKYLLIILYYIIECINECTKKGCVGENPDCIDEESSGCRTCADGFWKESNNHPCVSCDIINNCSECKNHAGCITCDPGFRKTWDTSCGYGINICLQV